MTEREELTATIAALEARRFELMADETRLHAAFMAEENEDEANRIATDLQDICGEIDEISGKLGVGRSLLHLVEGRISRREFLEDHPVGGRMP
jgi:hypothetical protein